MRNPALIILCTWILSGCSGARSPFDGAGASFSVTGLADTGSNTDSGSPLSLPTPAPAPTGSEVRSPFQLTLGLPTMNTILLQAAVMPSLKGTIRQQLPDLNQTDPFTVSVKGIQLSVNYAFKTPVLNAQTQEWEFTTDSISADVTVGKISAQETIVVNVAGTQMSIRVDASCDSVHLVLPPGASQAKGVIALGINQGQPSLALKSFVPQWTPGAWQVASMHCTGPQGFGDLVAKAVAAQLRTIDPYVEELTQTLDQSLQAVVKPPIQLALKLSDKVGVTLKADSFTELHDDKNNPDVQIKGTASFQFKTIAPASGCGADIGDFKNEPSTNPTAEELVLPFSGVQALVSCGYLAHAMEYQMTSADVPAFASLVNNWLEDLIVWPDLLRFKHDSKFQFDLKAREMPSLSNPWKSGDHKIALDAWLPLELDVLAPIGQDHVPYVDFKTDFSGAANLSVINGVASVQIDRNAKLSLSRDWDPAYVAKYDPDQRIWMQGIDAAAKKFLSKQGLTFKLPLLKVGEQMGLAPISADLEESDNLHLTMALKSLN